MSRIGRKPIELSKDVKIDVVGQNIKVKGPLGQLDAVLPEGVTVTIENGTLHVQKPAKTRSNQGYQGLARALIANMVLGVTKGYSRTLEIQGVGYKAELNGNTLNFALGYSHPIAYDLPPGVTATVEKQTTVTVTGIDKQSVGQVAAQIRSFKKPEPYKSKGVKYQDETVRRKVGKTGVGGK